MNNLKAILAHISDLHFHSIFTNERDTSFSKFGMAPHDFKLLCSLKLAFNEIPNQLQRSLNLPEEPNIDLVIVTGDITTDSTEEAFGNASTYIFGEYRRGKSKIGLNMEGKALIVPGNHDCLLLKLRGIPFFKKKVIENRSHFYYEHFELCPYIEKRKFNGMDILLIGLDSNKVPEKYKYTAHGKIGQEQLLEMQNNLIEIKKQDEEYYNNCFKIVFFHHHLIPPDEDNTRGLKKIIKKHLISHILEDASDVRDMFCENKIDLALFGHEHKSYHLPFKCANGNMIISCAGTTTQLDRNNNNCFKLYLFFSDRIQIIEYEREENASRFKIKMPLLDSFPYPNHC